MPGPHGACDTADRRTPGADRGQGHRPPAGPDGPTGSRWPGRVTTVLSHLQLNDRRERLLVAAADLGLAAVAPVLRRSARAAGGHDRPAVLLLRLERVGDLLMTLDALAAVRACAPRATIDLVVGTWNEALARLIPGIDRVETLDARWLARGPAGDGPARMLSRAWRWRERRYDLAINFEGDVRSNVLLGLSGALRRVGFDMAGGGPMLSERVTFDPTVHTRSNALRLVERAFDVPAGSLENMPPVNGKSPRLRIPDEARRRAAALLSGPTPPGDAATSGPSAGLVAVHVSGGREIKQWHPDRFADVASRLAAERHVRIVLTGSAADRPLVDALRVSLAPHVQVIDVTGAADLVTLAAIFERVDLLVTGDTGPMHLAAALDVPLVAVFGPSDPARWGPLSPSARIVRAQLPCSPCNRIRRPPVRCRGHVPDCLAATVADTVYDAAVSLLDEGQPRPASLPGGDGRQHG